jgi:hypothetical protein
LNSIGWKYWSIANQLKVILDQVRYAVTHQLTPQKRGKRGPRVVLSTPVCNRLQNWLESSPSNRMVPWPEIPVELDWNVGFDAIESSMGGLGYYQRVQRRKSPNKPRTRQLQIGFAQDTENLTVQDWMDWIWSDETWVLGGTRGKR